MFAPIPGFVYRRGAHWGLSTLQKHPPKRLLSPWVIQMPIWCPGREEADDGH